MLARPDANTAKKLETPLALRQAIQNCTRAKELGARRAEELSLLKKIKETPRTRAKRDERDRKFRFLLFENKLELQRRQRGSRGRYSSVWERGELRGHGAPREHRADLKVITMNSRRGKEVAIAMVPRGPPLRQLVGPSAPPRAKGQQRLEARKRDREGTPMTPTPGSACFNASYEEETEDEGDTEDDEDDDEHSADTGNEEEDEEEDDSDTDSTKSTRSSESRGSKSESDEDGNSGRDPRLPSAEDKLRLLQEFESRRSLWFQGLGRGSRCQRDKSFWEEVRQSLNRPRVFATWGDVASAFRAVISHRKTQIREISRPAQSPESDRERLIDSCVKMVMEREMLDDMVNLKTITLDAIPEKVRHVSILDWIREVWDAGAGGRHARRHNRNGRDESDGEEDTDDSGSGSDSADSAVCTGSSRLWQADTASPETPASSPVPDEPARRRHCYSQEKRGRDNGQRPHKKQRISEPPTGRKLSLAHKTRNPEGKAPDVWDGKMVAEVKELVRSEYDKEMQAAMRKAEKRVLGRVDKMCKGISRGKARL